MLGPPDFPDAFFERGRLGAFNGDNAGACQDFLCVLEISPKTEVDSAAQRQLEKLDITAE